MGAIHPLTGKPKNGKSVNGHAVRPELRAAMQPSFQEQRASLTYDAARDGTDLDGHWQFSDSLDADNSNSQGVRHKLIKRSRYEQGSNAFYDGIICTHANMLVGVGPTLRMLTKNRDFNQLVEREFYKWSNAVQLRRKLWAMSHAVTGDGESFALLRNNLALSGTQLDILPIEAEQCQSPYLNFTESGYIDGIKFDEHNNIQWYDILPNHPGGNFQNFFVNTQSVRVAPANVVHWFKLKRPGSHRGIPALTAGMNTGALARRHREATVTAAETAASIGAMLTSTLNAAGDSEPDPVAPFTSVEFARRMLMIAPMGWDAKQMKGEHPNAQYAEFHRLLLTELARGISMPYNAAACDSSTYSFASGKLDTLCYRAALDVERQDCNDLVLDPIFSAWFREWTILAGEVFTPDHQWDWPKHPIIDDVADANATQTNLATGRKSLRQVFSDDGKDFEDELSIMAEDMFGEATEETILKARQIATLRNVPQHAIAYVAQLMGISAPQPYQQLQQPQGASANA